MSEDGRPHGHARVLENVFEEDLPTWQARSTCSTKDVFLKKKERPPQEEGEDAQSYATFYNGGSPEASFDRLIMMETFHSPEISSYLFLFADT